MNEFQSIGRKIKAARTSMGYSQAELAKKCGYEKSSMSRIESGEIDLPVSKIKKFSKVLKVPVDYLIGDYLVESDRDPVKLIQSLPKEQQEAIMKLIERQIDIQEAEQWQQLSGTEEDGASESAKEEKSDPSHQRRQDDLEGVK